MRIQRQTTPTMMAAHSDTDRSSSAHPATFQRTQLPDMQKPLWTSYENLATGLTFWGGSTEDVSEDEDVALSLAVRDPAK